MEHSHSLSISLGNDPEMVDGPYFCEQKSWTCTSVHAYNNHTRSYQAVEVVLFLPLVLDWLYISQNQREVLHHLLHPFGSTYIVYIYIVYILYILYIEIIHIYIYTHTCRFGVGWIASYKWICLDQPRGEALKPTSNHRGGVRFVQLRPHKKHSKHLLTQWEANIWAYQRFADWPVAKIIQNLHIQTPLPHEDLPRHPSNLIQNWFSPTCPEIDQQGIKVFSTFEPRGKSGYVELIHLQ